MPKKKVENLSEVNKDDKQVGIKQFNDKGESDKRDEEKHKLISVDIEKEAEKLANRILRVLYATYGAKDSHTNKHLYHRVMFEVAHLLRKTMGEVMQEWPKFDIFTISDSVRKVIREELEYDLTIMYRVIMNDRIIADRILAKAIVKHIMQ
jgi:hypothetical protein